MNTQEQIQLINETINKTKEQLRPSSINFIFWGLLIALISLIHYLIPGLIQSKPYSTLLYWTVIPILGMAFTILYNMRTYTKIGYQTHIGRALKLIWGVFNVAWIILVVLSVFKKQNPVSDILFLLGIVLVITALLIRFTPLILGGMVVLICSIGLVVLPELNPLLINTFAAFFGLFVPGLSLYLSKTHV